MAAISTVVSAVRRENIFADIRGYPRPHRAWQWLKYVMAWQILSLCVKKGKAVVTHVTNVHGGAEVGLHTFLVSALDWGHWWTSRPGCFTSREWTVVTIEWEAAWAPETVWAFWRVKESLSLTRIRTPNLPTVS